MPKALIVEIFANAKQFGAELDRAAGKTRRFSKAAGVAGLAIAGGLAYGLEKSVVSAGRFQENMQLITTQAGASEKSVKSLSSGVLSLAGPTATAPDELAAGMYHLISQGLKPGKQALDALRTAAKGATIGHANLEDVTNALGAAMASGIRGVSNLDGAMGMMNATVGAGDMRMQDLADAMGTGVLANAKLVGISLKDVDAALAVFGDNNIRGAKAGNILNSTLRVMNATSGAGTRALALHGISSKVLAQKLAGPGGLVSALSYLKDEIKKSGMSSVDASAMLTDAFGGRQAQGIRLLMGQMERLKTKEEEVGKGAGKFGSSWKKTTETVAFKFKSMKEGMAAVGVNIGTALLPAVTRMVSWLAKATGWLSQHKAVTKLLVIAIAGLAAAMIAVSIATKVASTVQTIWNAGKKIGIALSKLFTATTEESAAATEAQTVATEAQSFAAKAAAAAQWLFNAAMDANPIILVIAAVAALGFAAYEIVQHWSTVRSFFVGLWHGIKGVFGTEINWIKGHWKIFLGLPGLVWQYWGPISGFFSGLWSGVKGVFNTSVSWVKSHWKIFLGLPGLVWQYWPQITGFFGKLWGGITGVFSGAISGIKGMFIGMLNYLIDKLNWLIDKYNSVAGWFGADVGKLGRLGGGGASASGPTGPAGPAGMARIPGHFRGGIVGPKPHLSWVGEGVREAIIPLHGPHKASALSAAIRHGLFDSMTPTGGGGGSSHTGHFTAEIPIVIPLMDGRVLRSQRSVALRAESRGNSWGDG